MIDTPSAAPAPFLGLRTAIYPASDLAVAKRATTALLGVEPYFDTDFYVGYQIAGYEYALDPNADPARGVIVYWGVADAVSASAHLVEAGVTPLGGIDDVGDGIRTALFAIDGVGGVLGIIENPHFQLVATPAPAGGGAGR